MMVSFWLTTYMWYKDTYQTRFHTFSKQHIKHAHNSCIFGNAKDPTHPTLPFTSPNQLVICAEGTLHIQTLALRHNLSEKEGLMKSPGGLAIRVMHGIIRTDTFSCCCSVGEQSAEKRLEGWERDPHSLLMTFLQASPETCTALLRGILRFCLSQE